MASGSVDQKNTYVFAVVSQSIRESVAKTLSYWSTGNGDDTMVTLWNPADEAQDFVFTLFFSGGHYLFPLHLGPRATQMFNVSEIIRSQIPDSEGNTIPVAVNEGSAEISGSRGENEHILIAMNAGIYNVQKATCGNVCTTCQGAVNSWVAANPFGVPYGGTNQLTYTVQYHSGHQYGRTSYSSWTSSDTSVATVNRGLVTAVLVGSVGMTADDSDEPDYWYGCSGEIQDCPVTVGQSGGGSGAVVAIPQNFRQTSTSDNGNGDLNFTYAWDSSTGNLADLSACTVGEIVTYPGTANPFPFPSPPFPPDSAPNPTVVDLPATSGGFQDDHKLAPSTTFVKPYSVSSFTATQYYRFKCSGYQNGNYVNLLGALSIVRSVSQNTDKTWKFTVTKPTIGVATINPLP